VLLFSPAPACSPKSFPRISQNPGKASGLCRKRLVFFALQASFTSCIIAQQLWAGGVFRRVQLQQPLCPDIEGLAGRLVTSALLTPLSEELFYRGVLQAVLINRLASSSPTACIFFSALFFAINHVYLLPLDFLLFAHHFAFGCCVGARVLSSNSIFPALSIHVANNAVVICASNRANGAGSVGGAALAPATIAYAACACADVLLMSKRWKHPCKYQNT
jgi:membrane protease YdiL (CAAX protease family)